MIYKTHNLEHIKVVTNNGEVIIPFFSVEPSLISTIQIKEGNLLSINTFKLVKRSYPWKAHKIFFNNWISYEIVACPFTIDLDNVELFYVLPDVRLLNILKKYEIYTIIDLLNHKASEIRSFKGIGKDSMNDIKDRLYVYKIQLNDG